LLDGGSGDRRAVVRRPWHRSRGVLGPGRVPDGGEQAISVRATHPTMGR
jgi:hypothetical protein